MAPGAIVVIINGKPQAFWRPENRQGTLSAETPSATGTAWISGEPANDNIDDLAPIIEHIAPASDRTPATAPAPKTSCGDRS